MVLVTDLQNIKNIKIKNYEKIYLVGYFNEDVKLFKKFLDNDNVFLKLMPEYFESTHHKAREFLEGKSTLEIGLNKLIRSWLFDMSLIEVIFDELKKEYIENFTISLKYNFLFSNRKSIKIINSFNTYKFSISYCIISFFKWIYLLLKFFILCLRKSEKTKRDILVFDFELKKHTSFLLNITKNIEFFTHDGKNIEGGIDYKSFLYVLGQQIKVLKIVFNNKYLLKALYIQLEQYIKYAKVLSQYEADVIFGTFDGPFGGELLYEFKDEKIKQIIYPHANFLWEFRLEYCFSPCDIYLCWSDIQKQQMQKINLNKDTKYHVVGNPSFASQSIEVSSSNEYDIFIPLEYYQEYSITPFNYFAIKKLNKLLEKLSKRYKVLVRARFDGGLVEDIQNELGDKIYYSIPSKLQNRKSILEEISSSKVMLVGYTGAINEGILMSKPIVHYNFYNIKSPFKEFADKNTMFYYAENCEEVVKCINKVFDDESLYHNNDEYIKMALNGLIFDRKIIEEVVRKSNAI